MIPTTRAHAHRQRVVSDRVVLAARLKDLNSKQTVPVEPHLQVRNSLSLPLSPFCSDSPTSSCAAAFLPPAGGRRRLCLFLRRQRQGGCGEARAARRTVGRRVSGASVKLGTASAGAEFCSPLSMHHNLPHAFAPMHHRSLSWTRSTAVTGIELSWRRGRRLLGII